ncbi:hypothetical protein JQ636_24715 [Bradyrhizobium japonicum]|uniref:hypothetical protein n=1 Tax=Bradyrhizobium japonicum TaxID=375 RepID=UPI001BA72E1E|nr:hypothetical protein [Bradyrhizobium japonicum]MBR0806758.1 hypothetical protein [Bradyrhizobium japonicum]
MGVLITDKSHGPVCDDRKTTVARAWFPQQLLGFELGTHAQDKHSALLMPLNGAGRCGLLCVSYLLAVGLVEKVQRHDVHRSGLLWVRFG